MKPPAALSSLLARLRNRPKALLVVLVAAVALVLGPIAVTLAAAAPPTGDHMPCEVSAGDHGGMTAQKRHDKSGGCASMQGAVCLTMVAVMSPASATIGRLPPRLVSTPRLVETVLSHATSPPHRPPKLV